ncbi:CAMK family protein kinase [Tritrichomonas foetus]|uniref:CAMK family protein kinase n=1 Tax=Tritrichomonas foetus TaxID=1144522 RepID=A0A1J4KF04_9EUKA|nr:CAMK family protein kinase [Tritrichomonas foetus]|eukprot:OHT09610.1 CAMK family protein kinase [Tritrichomonas foetus]
MMNENGRQSLHAGNISNIRVHDYMLGDQIGQGAFAQIRVAFHHASRLTFASKVISKSKLSQAKSGKMILFNETVLAPLLDFPSIIEIVDVADSCSQVFQFMRFAEHGDLLQRLRRAPFTYNIAIRIIDQILAAVEYLHANGIVHRDIKLENILLAKHTGAKLADFGLATMTFDGNVTGNCGSYEYSAPEAIYQPVFDGFRADMWSVGVVIYAIFARNLPFHRTEDDLSFNVPVDLTPIPENMRFLVNCLLSLDPSQRPSATEARFILANFVNNFPPNVQSNISSDFNAHVSLNGNCGLDGVDANGVIQRERIDPLSMLCQPDLLCENASIIISKLSQAMHVPCQTMTQKLTAPGFNRSKVLYNLLQRKLQRIGMQAQTAAAQNVFQFPYQANSQPLQNQPIQPVANQINMNHPIQGVEFLQQQQELMNFQQNIQNMQYLNNQNNFEHNNVAGTEGTGIVDVVRQYPCCASMIYDRMHSFLLRQKCCVSSPISSSTVIVQHANGANMTVSFDVSDALVEGAQCGETAAVLALRAGPESAPLSALILRYFEESFAAGVSVAI